MYECPVCLDPFSDGDGEGEAELVKMPCNHKLCQECYLKCKSLAERSIFDRIPKPFECPLCRHIIIDMNDFSIRQAIISEHIYRKRRDLIIVAMGFVTFALFIIYTFFNK